MLVDLVLLPGQLGLEDLSLALVGKVGGGAHRERAGKQARDASDDYRLIARAGARHARDDAEYRRQPVVDTIDRVANSAAGVAVSALAPED